MGQLSTFYVGGLKIIPRHLIGNDCFNGCWIVNVIESRDFFQLIGKAIISPNF